MAEEIFYQDFKITAESYQGDDGKWIPQARISLCPEEMNVEQDPLVWPKEMKDLPGGVDDLESAHCELGGDAIITEDPLNWSETFDTREEADDFALESAQLFIDESYY